MDADEEINTCKVVLLGESGVGKTTIIAQFIEDYSFSKYETVTTSASFSAKQLHFDKFNKDICFEIWDTAGQEKYRSLNKLFYKNAAVAILVYDITRKNSFDELSSYWVSEIRNNSPKNIILAIVGNKGDLSDFEQVEEEAARNLAKENKAIFRITSAMDHYDITELFQEIGNKFLDGSNAIEEEKEEIKKLQDIKKNSIRISRTIKPKNKKSNKGVCCNQN